ncbi:hypothetical protein [Methylobacterium sp. Leaf113]|uniref:hypothetical protein n=1 Tax=Methylobacterium sp. Leaf113 TaxID=1736259 RepID=UPI000B0B45FA|nr:hypothetical protein [Methylobacterium sp. Leaf113]
MSGTISFGQLEDVAVREAWTHEALGFTPWLAANLDRLGEALGMKLEHVGSEVAVTRFAADIRARNVTDGTTVLIENQLEVSDHGHLGQILTYLAGLEAHTVIWVAPRFHEAHLSAIRWLNQHTTADFSFFAVKLRVVRIGESPFAPLFDVLERPNDWEKRLQESAQGAELGPVGERRLAFWKAFCERAPEEAANGKPQATIQRWAAITGTDFVLSRFIADRYVGLCVRGPRGAGVAQVAEQLSPFADTLAGRFGVSFDSGADYLFMKTIAGSYFDPAERDRLISWLSTETDRYKKALVDTLA